MQKKTLFQVAVLAAGAMFLMADIGNAQQKKQGGRQPGGRQGGGFGQRGGGFGGGGTFGMLTSSEYLQKELNLTAEQKKRMKEINIQVQGTQALTQDDVAKELGISESQKEKINEARTAAFQGLRGGGNQGQRPNFEEMRKKFDEARTKADKEVLSVLTKSQQEKFEKMKGKPIDRDKIRPQGAGGAAPRRPDV